MLHFPVLLEESIDFLVNDRHGSYIDCTFGGGSYSKEILKFQICNNCIMDTTAENIVFDQNGVCNFCKDFEN